MKYCLGKKPAKDTVKLKLRDYLDLSKLPTPPDDFGHETLIKDWQMLGNDTAGDCGIVGPYHGLMYWDAEADKTFDVNTQLAIDTYSQLSGYDPITGANDTGLDVQQVAEFWRTEGLKDLEGNSHKIDCYAALQPGNIDELWAAMYLFDGVGIGVEFPEEWMNAFQAGQAWDQLAYPHIAGGHFIWGVGRRAGHLNVVTWGKTQLVTPAGYEAYCDEALVYLDEERLVNGKDINGFDLNQLKADLLYLTSEPIEGKPNDTEEEAAA